jgi:tetratricopeptide (TPR) repeat protein
MKFKVASSRRLVPRREEAMRIGYVLSAICALVMTASAAEAQVLVIGDGPASDCWRAAEFGAGTMNEGFAVCTQALSQLGLSTRDRAASYTNRAVIRMRAGDYAGSLADADASIGLLPSMGEAYVNRGAALLNLMKPRDALTAINKGLELGTGKLHLVYYDRAAAKEILGDIRGAYNDYKMAIQEKPDFGLAAEQLARFTVVRRAASLSIDRFGGVSQNDDADVTIALKTPLALPPKAAE